MHQNNRLFAKFAAIASLFFLNTFPSWAYQALTGYTFPIEHYSQTIADWIKTDSNSDKLLVNQSNQNIQFENFKAHYIGLLSPWNKQYTDSMALNLRKATQYNLHTFDKNYTCNPDTMTCEKTPQPIDKQGRKICNSQDAQYNQILSDGWIEDLTKQVNLSQLGKNTAQGKGIAIDNLNERALPTDDHYFHDCTLPGEGDSFDYLQVSTLWAGTPVYILGESTDHRWYYIVSPSGLSWVKSAGIARASDQFAADWTAGIDKGLVAINSPMNDGHPFIIKNEATNKKYTTGYIGAVFPLDTEDSNGFHVLIPVADKHQHQALISHAYLSKQAASLMPLPVTINNMIKTINYLKGRTYVWGGGGLTLPDPTEFNNDCSAELKSLFTPFGIFLPRHSTNQVDTTKMLGVSDDFTTSTMEERIQKLSTNGHPFTTIVYIGGHVFLYLGNYADLNNLSGPTEVLTYQNMWGLHPVGNPDGRYVIGKSVLFPLLARYPETYPDGRPLDPLANKSFFKVAYLDQLSVPSYSSAIQAIWRPMTVKELYALTI